MFPGGRAARERAPSSGTEPVRPRSPWVPAGCGAPGPRGSWGTGTGGRGGPGRAAAAPEESCPLSALCPQCQSPQRWLQLPRRGLCPTGSTCHPARPMGM